MTLVMALVYGCLRLLGYFDFEYDWLICFLLWWTPFKGGWIWQWNKNKQSEDIEK